MHTTSSTITLVRARLVDVLANNPVLTGVQVSHGYPGEGLIKREAIYVDRVVGAHKIANIKAGRKQRDEEYTVTVVISVVKDAGTIAVCEARAFELLEQVEDTLADDPALQDLEGVVHATAAGFRMFSDMAKQGPACVIEFDIDVRARLI